MQVNRLSAYSTDDDATKVPLDFRAYSKFKYGHRPTALAFADQLAKVFLESFGLEYLKQHTQQLIVSTSPFWYTPPPANTLAIRFHFLMNDLLVEHKSGPLRYVKIHRSAAPRCDFSMLSCAEREANMKADALSADATAFLRKKVILIEDARITGSHEKKTIAYMEHIGVSDLTFLYGVMVPSGADDPDIENRMNHYWMNNLRRLGELMAYPEDYAMNARACRYILSYPDKQAIRIFAKQLTYDMLAGVCRYAVGDGYGLVEKYREGFFILREQLRDRDIKRTQAHSFVVNYARRLTSVLTRRKMAALDYLESPEA